MFVCILDTCVGVMVMCVIVVMVTNVTLLRVLQSSLLLSYQCLDVGYLPEDHAHQTKVKTKSTTTYAGTKHRPLCLRRIIT